MCIRDRKRGPHIENDPPSIHEAVVHVKTNVRGTKARATFGEKTTRPPFAKLLPRFKLQAH
eukprot:253755-Pyramimonas_sp.AAC.1